MGEKRNVYRILVGEREEKRPLGKPRCRLGNNNKMDLKDTGFGWSGLDLPGSG
jgi:hypothetical protein